MDFELTIGRIVHYQVDEGTFRPAIVVRDWSKTYGQPTANLQVFVDGTNDRGWTNPEEQRSGLAWRTSVHYGDRKGAWLPPAEADAKTELAAA